MKFLLLLTFLYNFDSLNSFYFSIIYHQNVVNCIKTGWRSRPLINFEFFSEKTNLNLYTLAYYIIIVKVAKVALQRKWRKLFLSFFFLFKKIENFLYWISLLNLSPCTKIQLHTEIIVGDFSLDEIVYGLNLLSCFYSKALFRMITLLAPLFRVK